jgi:hypothetical protein
MLDYSNPKISIQTPMAAKMAAAAIRIHATGIH